MRKEQEPEQPAKQSLKGWKAIAAYLGIPVGTAQRWARTGMPLRREGRSITVNVNELTDWLGRESHMPGAARVATEKRIWPARCASRLRQHGQGESGAWLKRPRSAFLPKAVLERCPS